MTTRTTVGQEKQGFRGVVAMTAATAALLGGVLLFQLRPSGDTTKPTTASHRQVSDLGTQVRVPASRYHEEPSTYAEMYSRVPSSTTTTPERGGMAELYAELQAGAGTGPVTSVAVNSMRDMEEATTVAPVVVDTMGGMAELYRDQRAAADQDRTRLACGDGVQPAICY